MARVVVVGGDMPAGGFEGRHAQALALGVALRVTLPKRREQGVSVELLVILHVAGVLEVEDREPGQVLRRERVATVAGRVAVEREETAGATIVEEDLALRH